eukprot:GHVL01002061.1.p1 GENE.GHVL01002061.1~~GHVL01002061.1.p1  ORF type:complete len:837 (-),score=101.40 GHVL01002061.1:1902-4412(-)
MSTISPKDETPSKNRRRQRRVHELLSQYYEPLGGDKLDDNVNLDSPEFNAAEHYSQLIQTVDLRGLLKHHRTLTDEISSLDSDMQMLVYENYQKFICATETIKKMKSNMDIMEVDMTRLNEQVKAIDDAWHAPWNTSLSEQLVDIERLTKHKTVVEKLQNLVKIPSMMSDHVRNQEYDEALQLWTKICGFLSRNTKIEAVKRIYDQGQRIVCDCREALHEQLTDTCAGWECAVKISKLLLSIPDESKAAILVNLLRVRTKSMALLLESSLDVIAARKRVREKIEDGDIVLQQADEEDIKDGMAGLGEGNDPLVQPHNNEILKVVVDTVIKTFVLVIGETVEGVVELFESREEQNAQEWCDVSGALEIFVETCMSNFENKFCAALNEIGSTSQTSVCNSLNNIREALRLVHKRFPQALSIFTRKFFIRQTQQAATLTFEAAKQLFLQSLLKVYEVALTAEKIAEPGSPSMDAVRAVLTKSEKNIVFYVCSALTRCQRLTGAYPTDRTAIQLLTVHIFGLVEGYLRTLDEVVSSVTSSDIKIGSGKKIQHDECFDLSKAESENKISQFLTSHEVTGNLHFVLSLIRIARHFEISCISKICQIAEAIYSGFEFENTRQQPLISNARKCALTAQTWYSRCRGVQLSIAGRPFFSKLHDSPIQVSFSRPIVEELMKSIFKIDKEVGDALGDHTPVSSTRLRLLGITDGMFSLNAYLIKSMKLFDTANKVKRCKVTGTVIKILLKGIIEYVRRGKFTITDVHQIQVDVMFMGYVFTSAKLLDESDTADVDELIREVLLSAKLRITDTPSNCKIVHKLLPQNVIEQICDSQRIILNNFLVGRK